MTQDRNTAQDGSRARRLGSAMPPPPTQGEEESLAAVAYRQLEERIVTLRLAPGEAITESRLASALGMGRTPVREAIQRLAWEGLVTIRPRLGILVTDLQPGDFTRVLDARHALEVLLAGAAARLAGPDARARLAACARDMAAAANAGDTEGFLRQDKLFDEIVARAADNPFAARVVAPLQTHSRRFWFRHFGRQDLEAATHDHTVLMQAVAGGDPVLARARADDLMAALQLRAASLAQVSETENGPG